MSLSRRELLALGGACAALGACGRVEHALGLRTVRTPRSLRAPLAGELDLVQHILARCTFGVGPEDRDELLSLAPEPRAAVAAWLALQLAPEGIDDGDCERELRRFDVLSLPRAECYEMHAHVLLAELTSATLLRAARSRRQLHEVVVELWSDHFNVDSSKGECAWLIASHDRDVIREHALGRFEDLLSAVAFSPAMLWYLDGRVNRKRRADEKPNENFARELLELHTLGVHGGYTQRDVMEVARCFTGWTVRDKNRFRKATVEFDRAAHDDGAKEILGERIESGGGESDARRVLAIVARHPSTARHIATTLCRRFLADEPPQDAIEATASAFTASGGDVASTLRALFELPEFLGERAEHANVRGAKLKRPFHFVASLLRATNARTDAGRSLCAWLGRLGQAPFQYPTPDGYPQEAAPWTGTLLWRWELARALVDGRIDGTRVDVDELQGLAGSSHALVAHVLGRKPSEQELATFARDNRADLALLLASPSFQRC